MDSDRRVPASQVNETVLRRDPDGEILELDDSHNHDRNRDHGGPDGVDPGTYSFKYMSCKACGAQIQIVYSGGKRLQESYWFGHKIRCEVMQ